METIIVNERTYMLISLLAIISEEPNRIRRCMYKSTFLGIVPDMIIEKGKPEQLQLLQQINSMRLNLLKEVNDGLKIDKQEEENVWQNSVSSAEQTQRRFSVE